MPDENSREPGGKLLRILGVGFGVAVIIGGTIGPGILRTPGEVAGHLQVPWLILLAWTLGGVYATLGAVSITELGAAIPKAGGYYVFVQRVFGNRVGFTVAWGDWLGQLASVAFSAIVIAEYAAELFPALQPWKQTVALSSIGAFAVLQSTGLQASAAFQNWTSVLKAGAYLSLAAACFLLAPGQTGNNTPIQHPPLASLILPIQAIVFTYDGWYTAFYFTEEDEAPSRNLLRSMLLGVLAITIIYVSLNAAFLYVLPASELAGSKLAAAQVAAKLFGAKGGRFVTLLSLISVPPLMSAALLMSTRVLFALGRDGIIPTRFKSVSASGTPRPAMWLCCGMAALMVVSGTVERLLAIAGFYYVIDYASAYVCLFALRRKEPELERPYKAWGYPYSTGVVLIASLAFLALAIADDRVNSLWAMAVLLVSVPLFGLMRR